MTKMKARVDFKIGFGTDLGLTGFTSYLFFV